MIPHEKPTGGKKRKERDRDRQTNRQTETQRERLRERKEGGKEGRMGWGEEDNKAKEKF